MESLDYYSVLVIAFGLAADCFAVSLSGSISMGGFTIIQVLRVAAAFGGFQMIMPVLGWLAGRTIVDFIAAYDHWIAFLLLVIIGGKMIRGSFRSEKSRQKGADISRGFILVTLAVATSIDSLAVGLTFAFLEVEIIHAVLTIGAVAFLATILGFYIGRKAGELVGKRAEIIGGIILIGIGLRILIAHLLESP